MESIGSVLQDAARKYGKKTFVFFKEEELSFREMNDLASRVANAFLSEGIRKGDRVAIMLANRPEYLSLWFGLNKIGASMVPINTAFTAYETAYPIDHSESRMVVTSAEYCEIVEKAWATCPFLEKMILLDSDRKPERGELFRDFVEHRPVDLPAIDVRVNDEAAILYTSGTCMSETIRYKQPIEF